MTAPQLYRKNNNTLIYQRPDSEDFVHGIFYYYYQDLNVVTRFIKQNPITETIDLQQNPFTEPIPFDLQQKIKKEMFDLDPMLYTENIFRNFIFR